MFTAKQLPSPYECVKDRGVCPAWSEDSTHVHCETIT